MANFYLKIAGKRYDFFDEFTLNLSYNNIASAFTFSGFFDPDNKTQRELFRPLQYKSVEVYGYGKKLLTGTILNTSTSVSNTKDLATVSGYSKTGVLGDSSIPLEMYPLQFDNLTLKEIATKLITPFGISLSSNSIFAEGETQSQDKNLDGDIQKGLNAKFDKTNADIGVSVADYLNDICKQRGLVLTHNQYGQLVITKPDTSRKSIATYIEGKPSTRIALSVNGQDLSSRITAVKQASIGTDQEGEASVNNNLVSVKRDRVVTQNSGSNDDAISVAKNTLANQYRAIRLTIETDRWQWYDGKTLRIIQPNQIIEVESPNNFLKKRTRFFVERVNFTGDRKEEKATITAVLPESFTGDPVQNNIFQ